MVHISVVIFMEKWATEGKISMSVNLGKRQGKKLLAKNIGKKSVIEEKILKKSGIIHVILI